MPGLSQGRRYLLTWALLTVVLVGCGGGQSGGTGLAEKIHAYLGTNTSTPQNWKGLTGNIMENNEYLRKKLTELECRIWKLENPGKAVPPECGQGGPPATRPSDPPKYP
jgi:hypothetical protein